MLLIIFVVITIFNCVNCNDKVRYAAVIYRHGDRTPVKPYPTDPYRNESLWPVKFGELTNIGKRQHYALGQWLRERYAHLLSSEFESSEIYVRSTDVDRTLMSAQANLAGMYPPKGKAVWDNLLPWQPIPVHTEPEREDKLLAMKKHCVEYDTAFKQYIHSKEYIERLSKYQDLMNYLTAYTGTKVNDYNDINDIYNNLFIENLYNFTLPNWTHTVFPDKMQEPAGYSFRTETATPLLAKLKVGPLLQHIVTQMVNKVAPGKLHAKKKEISVAIFSGHDLTIGNVLNALGMYDGVCPVYTATVFLELLHDNSTRPLVRISYRNTTRIEEPHVLYIPNCGYTCPLNRFIHLYENLLTVNWEHECEEKILTMSSKLLLYGIGLLIAMYSVYNILRDFSSTQVRTSRIFKFNHIHEHEDVHSC